MKRLLVLASLFAFIALGYAVRAGEKEKLTPKEALQALNDFIGSWDGSGHPEKARVESKDIWKETVNWSWRFKGNDAWLVMEVKDGRYFKGGKLRYLPDKKRYQLTVNTKDKKELVFEGELIDDILTLERQDKVKKETQRLKMNLAAEGARFVYRFEHKPQGRTIFTKDYLVGLTKEGESLGGNNEKKIECIVSGGLGKIQVGYRGTTYYVCCTGCRDAFNENPEKYIKEFEAKKAGKK